jgi:hypothetical protein
METTTINSIKVNAEGPYVLNLRLFMESPIALRHTPLAMAILMQITCHRDLRP